VQTLDWAYCRRGFWYLFCDLDPKTVTASGVYVVWRKEREAPHRSPETIYVGQAFDVGSRLSQHQSIGTFNRFRQPGWDMFVTWANVDVGLRDGVERFLANALGPKFRKHPNVQPISVNLPPDLV
jgi:hypothetical protein